MGEGLDERRFDFEREKARKDEEREAKKGEQERSARFWQIMVLLLPLASGVVGYFIQSAVARNSAKVRFIDRQLSELYYPVQLRLRKDNALQKFWNDHSKDEPEIFEEMKAAQLRNHLENIATIEKHADLLRNSDERFDIRDLLEALLLYQRHVTLFAAIQAAHNKRSPYDVDHEWGYPKSFENQIDQRTQALELQRCAEKNWWRFGLGKCP